MNKNKPFVPGQTIRCLWSDGYHFLTVGKHYIIVAYEPEIVTSTFTWPAYVYIIGDDKRKIQCHASRFESVSE